MDSSGMGGDDMTGSSRFSPITETDHAGYIWVITIIGTAYTALSLLLRAWIKYRVYGWDDLLIAIGTVLHLGQSVAVYLALSYGLAKSNTVADPADGPAASKAWFASELLGLLVLGFSKCSVLALMMRVFTPETGTTSGYRACLTLTTVSAVWCIASVIAISARCDTATILSSANKDSCPGLYDRLLGIKVPDMITDVMICLIPPWATMPLHMTKGVRFHVSLAFSFRLFVVPLAALQLSYFKKEVAESADAQFDIANSLLFQQVALIVSLISATIPNLRTFMKSINSGFSLPPLAIEETRGFALRTFGGSTMIHGRSSGSNGRHNTSGNHTTMNKSFATSSGSRDRDRDNQAAAEEELSLRPDGVHHEARISHVRHTSDAASEQHSSINRSGSQERIITKRMEWDVRHDAHDSVHHTG
ncbi:hypothetical protein PG996_009083 [Apiospora saccharicola]|uniref:Rhodopsin domain-containing protein n=1 Tax=Apiospora saccharicola TaxID=335842 RepID=A0ABR1UJS2_9PEZI